MFACRRLSVVLLAVATVAVVTSACGPSAQTGTAPVGSQAPSALGPDARESVHYCAGQSMLLTAPDSGGARPAVLFVHGGDWTGGSLDQTGFVDQLRPALNRAGFVVAAIDYRLAPKYKAPAQTEDTACAVRYLRAWAHTLGIDPARIGAWGDSAGGQLVSMVASPHHGTAIDE